MLKLPEMPGKHHMIGYKPAISESSKRYVHHMMLYECHDEVYRNYYLLKSVSCLYDHMMNEKVSRYIQICKTDFDVVFFDYE